MKLIVLLCMAQIIGSSYLYLSMNKILYIPGQRYSLLELKHDFSQFETNLFDIQINLNITQTSQNNQTNSIFDILYTSNIGEKADLVCYNEIVAFINQQYDQYRPCKQICDLNNLQHVQSRNIAQQFSQIVGNQSYREGNATWIIDNTFYPCTEGAYQPELYLQQMINVSIQENKYFLSLIQVVCVVLLQIMIISLAYLIIILKKYKKIKSDFQKLKSQQQAQELLDSFLDGNNEQSN